MRTGETDKHGRIVDFVFHDGEDFCVYRSGEQIYHKFSEDNEVKLRQESDYLSITSREARVNYLILIARPDRISRWLFGRYWSDSVRHYHDSLARAISQALQGSTADAIKALDELSGRIETRIKSQSRTFYLVMSAAFAICFSVLYAFFDFIVPADHQWNGVNVDKLMFACFFGVLGATFSVTLKLAKLEVEANEAPETNLLNGAVRVMIGAFGAVTAYFAMTSGLVNGLFSLEGSTTSINEAKINSAKLAFVSIFAGFSERFVPGILNAQDEKASVENDKVT